MGWGEGGGGGGEPIVEDKGTSNPYEVLPWAECIHCVCVCAHVCEKERERETDQLYLHALEGTRGSLQVHHMQVVCQSAKQEKHILNNKKMRTSEK